jgi:hypothetical protein
MTEDRIGELERRLEQLEQGSSPRQRGKGALDVLVPPDARRHLRNAGREQMLAVRSLLDYWIDQLVDADDEGDEPNQGREQIRID